MRTKACAALLLALTFATGCPPADEPPPVDTPPAQPEPGAPPTAELPPGATQDMVAEGQALFAGAGICYTCHGADAMGTPLGPNLTDQQWLNTDGSYEQIVEVIRTGVPQPQQYPGTMPPMGGARLTDEQVRALGAYVYSISRG
jgi:mono/diheme cytochrome c family protein